MVANLPWLQKENYQQHIGIKRCCLKNLFFTILYLHELLVALWNNTPEMKIEGLLAINLPSRHIHNYILSVSNIHFSNFFLHVIKNYNKDAGMAE
jgi:hypothetical protein